MESALKMHQNEYKQTYVWSSGSSDNRWYFHKQDAALLFRYVVSIVKSNTYSYVPLRILIVVNMSVYEANTLSE